MIPGQRGRHCASCGKAVIDLTRMERSEAVRFLDQAADELRGGVRVCIRANVDRTGRVRAPSNTRRLLTNGLAAVIAMTLAGCHGDGLGLPAPTATAVGTTDGATIAHDAPSSPPEAAGSVTTTAKPPLESAKALIDEQRVECSFRAEQDVELGGMYFDSDMDEMPLVIPDTEPSRDWFVSAPRMDG